MQPFTLLVCLLSLLTIQAYCHPLHDEIIFGSMHMDEKMLTKMIDGTRPVLIKIDKEHAAHDKREEFKKLIEFIVAGGVETRLLVGIVGVQGPDDMDPIEEMEMREGRSRAKQRNVDIAMKFNIMPKDCPAFMLWQQGQTFADEPQRYTGEVLVDHIVWWLRENGVYVADEGCFEEFDHLAQRFMSSDDTGRGSLIEQAEAASKRGFDGDRQKSAPVYASVMKKLVEQGNTYYEQEMARIKRVLEGQLSEKKREMMRIKRSVL